MKAAVVTRFGSRWSIEVRTCPSRAALKVLVRSRGNRQSHRLRRASPSDAGE
jgi:hypothetical protein